MGARVQTRGLERMHKTHCHPVGGKPSFVTERAGWLVAAEIIAKGRMFIWSDGARDLEKSEVPVCRALQPQLPSLLVTFRSWMVFDS